MTSLEYEKHGVTMVSAAIVHDHILSRVNELGGRVEASTLSEFLRQLGIECSTEVDVIELMNGDWSEHPDYPPVRVGFGTVIDRVLNLIDGEGLRRVTVTRRSTAATTCDPDMATPQSVVWVYEAFRS